eukprot:scaffold5623_cov120-Amphora_coffeaeformis.AAC.2
MCSTRFERLDSAVCYPRRLDLTHDGNAIHSVVTTDGVSGEHLLSNDLITEFRYYKGGKVAHSPRVGTTELIG